MSFLKLRLDFHRHTFSYQNSDNPTFDINYYNEFATYHSLYSAYVPLNQTSDDPLADRLI